MSSEVPDSPVLNFLPPTGPDFDAPPPWKKGFEIPIYQTIVNEL